MGGLRALPNWRDTQFVKDFSSSDTPELDTPETSKSKGIPRKAIDGAKAFGKNMYELYIGDWDSASYSNKRNLEGFIFMSTNGLSRSYGGKLPSGARYNELRAIAAGDKEYTPDRTTYDRIAILKGVDGNTRTYQLTPFTLALFMTKIKSIRETESYFERYLEQLLFLGDDPRYDPRYNVRSWLNNELNELILQILVKDKVIAASKAQLRSARFGARMSDMIRLPERYKMEVSGIENKDGIITFAGLTKDQYVKLDTTTGELTLGFLAPDLPPVLPGSDKPALKKANTF